MAIRTFQISSYTVTLGDKLTGFFWWDDHQGSRGYFMHRAR